MNKLNECRLSLSNCFIFNGLLLNSTKTDIILTGSRHQLKSIKDKQIMIKIADCEVKPSDTLKLLGFTYDSELNLTNHVNNICKSANINLKALKHIRKHLDVPTATTVACSLLGSRIDYCNSLLTGITDYNIHRLQKVQNYAAKIVTNKFHQSSEATHVIYIGCQLINE